MTEPEPDAAVSTARSSRRHGPGRPTRSERRRETRRRLREANFAGAIYGQIIVLSLLAVLGGHGEHPGAGKVAATVASSQLVFWLAHAYAEILSRQIRTGERIQWREVGHVMEHEWPLVQAAGPTLVLMLIAAVSAMEVSTGIDLAIGLGVLQLFGWGAISGRRAQSLSRRLLVATLSAALGLLVVALKVLIH